MTLLLLTIIALGSYHLGRRSRQPECDWRRDQVRMLLRLDSDAKRDELTLPRRAA